MNIHLDFISVIVFLGISQGIFLGLVLFAIKRTGNRLANRLLGFLLISVSLNISNEFAIQIGLFKIFPHGMQVFNTLQFLFGPLFYFYVRVLISKQFPFKYKYLVHALPFILIILHNIPMYLLPADEKIRILENVYTGGALIERGFIQLLFIVHLFCYIILSYRLLKKHTENIKSTFSSIEKINLNWIRLFICFFLLIGSLRITLFLVTAISGTFQSDLQHYFQLLITIAMYAGGYRGLVQPAIFLGEEESVPAKKYETSTLTAQRAEQYQKRLIEVMDTQKPYTDSTLTLQKLASLTSIPPYHLSQILNERLRQNFYDFINSYRVEEAKRLLNDETKKHYSILAIANEAGFNSKSVFNTVFKKIVQLTPSEYRR
jgi:AraC-like DNA-binding protein